MADSGLLKNRDIEYDDLEFDRNDMLTGEPRYVEDEIRNSKFAMILGGLAGVLCLVAMILTWILYFRERTRTFLWHAIWLIFAFLFGFALAAWGAGTEPQLRVGKQPSANFTLAIFLGSLIFFVYLVAESLWLVFYKPIHYGYLVGLRGNNDLWNQRMISGSTFDQGWTADRRMMWWVTAFTLVSGLCFAFGAFATRSVVWNRFQLTRIGLFASLISVAVAGFLVIYWAEECFEYESTSFFSFDKDNTRVLKVLAILAIIFAFLNGIVNFVKSKLGYFILGAISIILLICFVASTGTLWRSIRVNQLSGLKGNCASNLASIHEDNLKNICINGGKYLPAGSQCTKEFYVNRWENGSTADLRVLNPSCCQVGASFFYLPYMQLAFWSIIVILSLGITIFFNFYLSDTSDYLSNSARPLNIIDFAGIGLLVAVLLGWILYYIFRKANKLPAGGQGFAPSFINPDSNKVSGFDIVPRAILANSAPQTNSNACFNYDTKTMPVPSFSSTDATCTSNCVHRVALLASGSAVNILTGDGYATPGDLNNRGAFFPGCTKKTNGYAFFFGTLDQVKKSLSAVTICKSDLGITPDIYLYVDQVPANSINSAGLRNTETGTTTLADTNGANCGTGFDGSTSTCTGSCQRKFILPNTFTTMTLKGSLFYIKDKASVNNVPGNLVIETSANGYAIGGSKQILANGLFTVADIPIYQKTDYVLRLVVSDPNNNVFLRKEIDILVPANNGGSDELSAGTIRLLTADGNVCGLTDAACKNAQKRSVGTIKLSALDATNEAQKAPLSAVAFSVNRWFVLNGENVATVFSDSNGQATANALPYEAYTVVATKTGYIPASNRVDLQDTNTDTQVFYLRPTSDDLDYRVFASMNDPTVDLDLKVNMRNPSGVTCQVSAYNKYCPYTAYLNDVSFGVGQEAVGIKRLAVAEYLAFVAPASPYDKACPAADAYQSTLGHYLQSWNWESIKTLKPLESLGISAGTTAGSFGSKVLAAAAKFIPGLDSLAPKTPVESEANSLLPKLLLGLNGKLLPPSQQTKISTNVKASKGGSAPVQKPSAYVEKSKNTATVDGLQVTTVEYTDKDQENVIQGKTVSRKGTSAANQTVVNGQDRFVKILNAQGTQTGEKKDTVNNFQFSNGSTQRSEEHGSNTSTEAGWTAVSKSENEFAPSKTGTDKSSQSHEITQISTKFPPSLKKVDKVQNSEIKGSETTLLTSTSEEFELAGKVTKSSLKVTQKSNKATGDSESETVKTSSTDNSQSSETTVKKTVKGVVSKSTTKKSSTQVGNASSKTESVETTETQPNKARSTSLTSTVVETSADGTVTETKTATSVKSSQEGDVNTETNTSTSTKSTDGQRTSETKFKKVERKNGSSDSERETVTKTFNKDNKQTEQVSENLTTNKSPNSTNKSIVTITTTYGENGPATKTENQTVITPLNEKEDSAVSTIIVFKYDDKGVANVVSSDTKKFVIPVITQPAQPRRDENGKKSLRRNLSMKLGHLQGSTGANYLLLNCFNGFGPASLVTLNSYLSAEPSFDLCVPKIASTKPAYTLAKLQDAIKAAA